MRVCGSRLVRGVLVVLVGCVGVMGCGDDGSESGSGSDEGSSGATPVTVLIGAPVSIPTFEFAVADVLGYFDEENIDLDYQYVGEDVNQMSLLANGNGDVATPGGGEMIQALASGQEVTMVYDATFGADADIVTLDGSEVESIEDLVGTTVGVGDEEYADFLRTALTLNGIEEAEVETVRAGVGGAAVARLLDSGDISAYVAGIPDFAALRAAGIDVVVELPNVSQAPSVSFVVPNDRLEEMKPTLVGLIRAYSKAKYVAQLDPDLVESILREEAPDDWAADENEARALLDEFIRLAERPEDGYGGLDEENWDAILDEARESGVIESDITTADFLDRSLLTGINDWDLAEVESDIAAYKEAHS